MDSQSDKHTQPTINSCIVRWTRAVAIFLFTAAVSISILCAMPRRGYAYAGASIQTILHWRTSLPAPPPIATPGLLPDLTVSAFSFGTAKGFTPLSPGQFRVTIENKGLGDVTKPYQIEVWFSKNGSILQSTKFVAVNGPPVKAGASVTVWIDFIVPLFNFGVTSQSTFSAVADGRREINEISDKNNSMKVLARSTEKPNLSLSRVSVSGAQAAVGQFVTFRAAVLSQGRISSLLKNEMRIYFSRDRLLDTTQDTLISVIRFPVLKARAVWPTLFGGSWTTILPNTLTPSRGYFIFALDPFNQLTESSETDNQFSLPFHIIVDKDLDGVEASKDCDDNDRSIKPGAVELCDGKDNNCDGLIDEKFLIKGQACQYGRGACLSKGLWVCSADKKAVSCSAKSLLPKVETCNDIDDDCDGLVDESLQRSCYSGHVSTRGQGLCKDGIQVCVAGKWSACRGEVLPATKEACDGKDNNCDGKVDETCQCRDGQTQVCGTDRGLCRLGKQTCVGGKYGACVGSIGPVKERCNGKDDDCDGKTDEDFATKDQTCQVGKGTCQRKGRWICRADGSKLVCDAKTGSPRKERCDGKDDDCDGAIDEDFATKGQTCTVGRGLCRSTGRWQCKADQTGVRCSAKPSIPSTEICNDKDDDCDGQVDEGLQRACFTGAADSRGKGICKDGIQICQAGVWESCKGQQLPSAEACDGLDNNCDGKVDEACQCQKGDTQSCGSDLGSCRKGKQTCVGGVFGPCVGEVTATDERCNGKDDDCDGQVDENFGDKGKSCTLGKGACEAKGTFVCVKDEGGLECDATPGKAKTEVCNGIDDDCDGAIDNNKANDLIQKCSNQCGKSGLQYCTSGSWSSCVVQACDAEPEVTTNNEVRKSDAGITAERGPDAGAETSAPENATSESSADAGEKPEPTVPVPPGGCSTLRAEHPPWTRVGIFFFILGLVWRRRVRRKK